MFGGVTNANLAAELRRAGLDIGDQVRADIVLVTDQPARVELGVVVKVLARFPPNDCIRIDPRRRPLLKFLEHRCLGLLQGAVQPAKQR
jgi:hypothetical protein